MASHDHPPLAGTSRDDVSALALAVSASNPRRNAAEVDDKDQTGYERTSVHVANIGLLAPGRSQDPEPVGPSRAL